MCFLPAISRYNQQIKQFVLMFAVYNQIFNICTHCEMVTVNYYNYHLIHLYSCTNIKESLNAI